MKIIFRIYLLFLIAGTAFAQTSPQLTSPANNSVLQRAMNLELVWQNVQGNSAYQVQYSLDNIFSPQGIVGDIPVTGTNLTIARLSNNRTYYWRVRVNEQSAPWSEVWSFTTTGLPVTPTIFLPPNNTINRDINLFFSWSRHETNHSHILQIAKNSGFSGLISNYLINDTFYVAQKLDHNTTYYWRVKALNIDNIESNWSNAFTFKTKLETPLPVFPANNTRNQDTDLIFRWDSSQAATIYNYQLATDSLFTQNTLVFNVDTNATELFITSLRNNTFYYWRVIASNESNDSSNWTPVHNFKTVLAAPVLFQDIDSLRNRDTSITFSWSLIPDVDYIVQLSTDSLYDSLIIEEVLSDTIYVLDSLNYNEKYFWRVLARNEEGDSSNWNSVTFKTRLKTPGITSPRNNTRNVSPDVTFNWESIEGAEEYMLRIAYDSLFSRLIADTFLSDTFYNAGTLAFDTTYYWNLLAFNSEGDSSKLLTLRFRTRPPLLVSFDTLNTVINLSERRTDSLTTITISNIGDNPFIVDSIKAFPDTLFSVDKSSAVIMPDEEEDFSITFFPGIIDTGATNGAIYFIRRNELALYDTLTVTLDLYIEKPVVTFSDSTLSYDSTDATESIIKELFIKNLGGNINLVIDSIIIIGTDTTAFKVVENPESSLIIQPGDSTLFPIEFIPQKFGRSTAVAQIISNAYPDTSFNIPLTGSGRGGELSSTTLARINSLEDSVFEALTENDKPIVFKNNGNAPLEVNIIFSQDKFKVENDFQREFTIKRGDSISLRIKYMIPDFSVSTKDTMRIIHNGFGEDTLVVFLEGTFDSLASSQKIQSELRLNGNQFTVSDKVINENTTLSFMMNPELLNSYEHLSFRINYYTGGHGERILAENDGSFNYAIPRELVNEKGLILSGQLLAYDEDSELIDSITVFTPVNVQVILKDFETIDVNIPRSIPAERAEDANTKWIMFGFPFEEVVADTVFKDFGGIGNMKDGEWIVYNYDFTVPDSFVVFNNYSFNQNTAYFAAQSLMDTFKISYQYKENIRTRKLTDSILTLPGTNWKTVSSPFLFDVEVDPSVVLRRYDTNNKIYKMTNIMKPGEGYFVEPAVSQIRLKTFGEFNPLFYPKILADIGWHIKVQASNKNTTQENIFSVENPDKLSKISSALPHEYASSPKLQKGLSLYTKGEENEQLEAVIKRGDEGAVFELVLFNNFYDDKINLTAETIGKLPENFIVKMYNKEVKEVVSLPYDNFFIKKGHHYNFSLVIGTEKFVNKTLADFSKQVPEQFALKQNYPNPFNPSTAISYQIPENSFVNLKIYDILGAEIATLVNEEKPAGFYKIDFNAAALASGVYFYRIITKSANKEYTDIKKMILLK